MVSMPYGPVLSATYDCFMGDREYWDSWIINPGNYDLALKSSIKVDPADPLDTFDELSVSEKTVLDSVYSKFSASNRWDLVKLLHDLLSRMGKPPRIILSHPHQIPPYEKRQNQGGNGCYSGKD